jgi:hypothetical protein
MIPSDMLPAIQVLGGSGVGLLVAALYLLACCRLKPGVQDFVVTCGLLPGLLLTTLGLILGWLVQ